MSGWGKKSGRMTGEAARRITGISTPIGGVQWSDPGPTQRKLARDFIVGLEDRRALYNPMYLEVRGDVDYSIREVRAACTAALRQFGENDFAVVPIRAVRAACRRFHDDSNLDFPLFHPQGHHREQDAGFFVALGALRATIGQQVVMLAAHYDLEVEGDLASVLPTVPEDES